MAGKKWILIGWVVSAAVLICAVGLCAASQEGKFQDTFNVDKTTLANIGSSTYMILEPGYKLILTDDKDTLTITVFNETKKVDDVDTRIIEERETKNGKLEEVSRNYFAIDKTTGDIYYFGEDVDMYDANGNVTGHGGSWLSGVNGAKFGLMIPANPKWDRSFSRKWRQKRPWIVWKSSALPKR